MDRDGRAVVNDHVVWPAAWDVAVLIAAHNRETRVAQAIAAAARMVPLGSVHLVSDDSTDRTADLARECGVRVVETMSRLGRPGAFEAGIQAFRLVDRFEFVILLDTDTMLEPHYLVQAMPLFADPTVTAVDGRVDLVPHRASGVLTAYRARAYAVAEWLRRLRPTEPPLNLTRVLPYAGRIYRTAALREFDVIDDFDATLQIHRKGLGHVAFCPTARLSTAQPTRITDHRRQTEQWLAAFRQATRRHRQHLSGQMVALLLFNTIMVLLPVAIVLIAVLPPAWVAVPAIVLPDYLLTLSVAIVQRQPRYLLPGLLFPFLRVLDAVSMLRVLPGNRPTSAWVQFDGRPAEPTLAEPRLVAPWPARFRPAALLVWVLLIGSAAAVVIRVALTAKTLPATSFEPALVDAAYGKVTGLNVSSIDSALTVTGLQLDAYVTVAGAFSRQASTLTSAREMSVVAAFVMLVGLVLIGALLRIRPLVTTICVATLAVSGPVIATLTPVGPGLPAAAWFSLAAAAAFASIVKPNGALVLVGLISLLLSLATAPIVVVPIGVGLAAWFAGKEHGGLWTAGATLVITACIAFVLWRSGFLEFSTGSDVLDNNQRVALLTVVAAAALSGLTVKWFRPVAAATAMGVVLAAVGVDVLLPVLVGAAAILVAVVIDDAVAHPRTTVTWVAARIPAAIAIAGTVAGALLVPAAGTATDHTGLAKWAADDLDGDARLVVPAGLWSDLARDRVRAGLSASTVRQAGAGPVGQEELVVAVGQSHQPGVALARFGSAPTNLTVLTQNDDETLTEAERANAGTQLAGNFRLHTTDEVHTALRSGKVDLRAMTVLAELCREHEVTVVRTGKPAAERKSTLPDRILVLSIGDNQTALRDWLLVQQPPYAPADIQLTPDGVVVRWRLPAFPDQAPR